MAEAPPVAPPPAAPPPVAPPAAPPPAAPPWHGSTEPDAAAYVATKGWSGPQDVIKSYQNAEKLIGRDPNTLITLPRADDPDGFRAVMSKLGLPESPDKYEFSKPPDGLTPDSGYETWARGTFHKLGLPANTVKALTSEHNAYVKSVMDQQTRDYDLNVQTEKTALLKEWGNGHERMLAAAKSAATTLGFTPGMIDAIEAKVGYAGTYKFFAALGQKMGEDSFVSADGKTPKFGNSLTPDEAKAAWDGMKLDPVMQKALFDNQHPGHAAAKAKQKQLFEVMYPA